MKRTIIVGTRQSQLALTQTGHVIRALEQICAEQDLLYNFEIKKIVTKGDKILDVTLSKVGGKGLFVKEIEQAMLDGEIDLAVHSMKDMPAELPEGLIIGAIPKREDPRDALISRNGLELSQLPQGAKIGTSSLRRSSQLAANRPDFVLEPLRGNIDSRLRKLEDEGFDAIILAAAGLLRMGWEDRITSYLPPEICLPAVGQGALGIECRESDEDVKQLLSLYNDPDTAVTVTAERRFLNVLGGSCQVPIGAFAQLNPGSDKEAPAEMVLTGLVGSPDGKVILKQSMAGNDPLLLGEALAGKLIAKGANTILASTGE